MDNSGIILSQKLNLSQNVEAPNPTTEWMENPYKSGFDMCFEEKQIETML